MLIEGGEKTLDMARQAALTAVAAGDRAEKEFNTSVSKIATELSRKLLDESQQWQVLKQSARNRRDAWRVALSVTVAALTLFVGGYVTAEWRKSADRADQAVLAAVQQCRLRGRGGMRLHAQGHRTRAATVLAAEGKVAMTSTGP